MYACLNLLENRLITPQTQTSLLTCFQHACRWHQGQRGHYPHPPPLLYLLYIQYGDKRRDDKTEERWSACVLQLMVCSGFSRMSGFRSTPPTSATTSPEVGHLVPPQFKKAGLINQFVFRKVATTTTTTTKPIRKTFCQTQAGYRRNMIHNMK